MLRCAHYQKNPLFELLELLDAQNMEHGTWNMQHGTWNMDHGTWIMDHGTWNMEHGTWNIIIN